MSYEKSFNDSVHGVIILPPLCVKIVDTLEFQRLRNLKQLGLAYLVYPGASHNRFEHSLGVCHLAGRMVDQLNRNKAEGEPDPVTPDEKLCIQIAGLCHDMGHGPFSHSWEGFLKEHAKLSEKQVKPWKHEKSSTEMFEHMIESNPSLGREFVESGFNEQIPFIKSLIEGKPLGGHEKVFLYEIISNSLNGVDVDKWDYFLRDGKYLNISQSFDHHRLLNTCRVMEVEDEGHKEHGKRHIAFRDKDAPNIWDMFQVRAQLHSKACQHPVVKVLEQMWPDALLAAEEEGYTFSTPEVATVRLCELQNNPKVWKYVTDHIFYDILSNGKRLKTGELRFAKAQDILRRILKRDIYKKIHSVRVPDPSDENVKKVEEEIKEIIRSLNLSSDQYRLRHLNIDMGKLKEGQNTPFENFFFYPKGGSRAKSIDISSKAIFPAKPEKLIRREILVLDTLGRQGSIETREKLVHALKEYENLVLLS